MDFSSFLKGATDTLKKLENDVTKAGKEVTESSTWQGWADAGEDDGWEDVADIGLDVNTTSQAKETQPVEPDLSVPLSANKNNSDLQNSKLNPQQDVSKGSNLEPAKLDVAPAAESENNESTESANSNGHPVQTNKTNGTPESETLIAELQAKLKEAQERASANERKVYALTRDRDALRRIRDSRASDAELVKEKDKQITAILSEGEKLSVKIAEREKAVRGMKTTLKEKESAIEDLQLSLSATTAKLEAAVSRQRQLETSEKAAHDGMEAAERRLRQVESESRSKSSSSAALEAARAQLESLRKSQTAALENQAMRLRAEHETALEQVTAKAKSQEESLNKAMMELRAHLTQVVDNAGWQEDQLRKEAEELRKRAEQLEARNEELAAALPNATRPLLRQVEALQAAASERVRAKSAVDKSQLERLRAAEAAVASSAEREKAAEERIGALMTKVASLEEQVKIGQAENGRLGAEIRTLQADNAELRLKHQREMERSQAQIIKANGEKDKALEDLSKERASNLDATEHAEETERQLRAQLASTEAKIEMLQESLTKAKSLGSGETTAVAGSQPSTGLVRLDSLGNISASSAGLGFGGSEFGDDSSILIEGASPSAGVYATERLASSLRQKNGEIASLQAQVNSKEAATQALAEEVVNLTARVEQLTKEMDDAPTMRKEFDELKKRHTALLELLGEREERIMELEADLSDVNQMYKEQVTELLLRIEKLSS